MPNTFNDILEMASPLYFQELTKVLYAKIVQLHKIQDTTVSLFPLPFPETKLQATN